MKKRDNYIDDGRIMMSNEIVIRQNEEKSIAMLAAKDNYIEM